MLLGMEKKCMSESISKAKRLPYWDTMKGILIILVVLGHFLWDFTTPEHPGIQFFIVVLYFFQMPGFVFISGFFCQLYISLFIVFFILFFFVFF